LTANTVAMHVVDHGPYTWFLLGDADRLYFDARVSRSAVEWSLLIELSTEERAEYAAQGKPYLDSLATRVDMVPEQYLARDLRETHGSAVTQTIVDWRAAGGGPKTA
jgi:hypothetical protein